jgi:hypothetical protein
MTPGVKLTNHFLFQTTLTPGVFLTNTTLFGHIRVLESSLLYCSPFLVYIAVQILMNSVSCNTYN